jgi:pyruvate formate lyase activating enzyme
VVSSYNEPLITAEWAASVFQEARAAGLECGMVSNGYATPEVLKYLRPYLSGYKIDLKTMQDKHYRELGGVLSRVLETIQLAHDLGLWVEVVTLVIPGFNDSPAELMDAAETIAAVSPDIPWHVTGFHPDYEMLEAPPTSPEKLVEAAEIGQEAGLNFVYTGNIPGYHRELESTFCPKCRKRLVHRRGYALLDYQLDANGCCPACGTKIPGLWKLPG